MTSSRVDESIDATVLAPATAAEAPAKPRSRLLGLDVVRAIAIISMIYVHVWPTGWLRAVLPPEQPVPGLLWMDEAVTNRAMSLFVFCAGVSVALMTGGARPPSGAGMTLARKRLVIRSVAMLPLALILLEYGESILLSYCVWFVLLLPFTKLKARPLFIAAAVAAVAGPLFRFVMLNYIGEWPFPVDGFALLLNPADWPYYLVGPDTPYAAALLFAGMGLGRLDLRPHAVRLRLMAAGAAAIAGSLAMWWVAAVPLGGLGALAAVRPSRPGGGEMPWISLFMMKPYGMFDISLPMGPMMIGIGFLLIGFFLIVMDQPLWERLLWPLAATGSLALTCYVGHFLLLFPFGNQPPFSFQLFLSIAGFVVVFSTLVRRWWRRGPLEFLIHRAMVRVVPDRPADRPAPARPATNTA
ncbi:heparan-alpha-glucosaminide N-acetyltransferase domain-containing protein [Sphaerisporangium sp. B11E5]|uniref:DUF418 domain-containing protein n=1 Tax=Sphaerisporangium sp. B11E5 TaxID=3153563 RepID=UPI00325C969E